MSQVPLYCAQWRRPTHVVAAGWLCGDSRARGRPEHVLDHVACHLSHRSCCCSALILRSCCFSSLIFARIAFHILLMLLPIFCSCCSSYFAHVAFHLSRQGGCVGVGGQAAVKEQVLAHVALDLSYFAGFAFHILLMLLFISLL